MNKMIILSVLVAIIAVSAYGIQSVFAQEDGATIEETIELAAEQAGFVILLGVGAGFLTAYQGYRTTKKEFDTLVFFDGVIMAVIASVPLAIGSAMTQTDIGVFEYVIIFFAALGLGNQIHVTRKSTVPSNEG